MSEVAEQPTKPPRTWLPMVGWTLGILAVLGLAWFCAELCLSVCATRDALKISIPQTKSVGWDTIDVTHAPPGVLDEWREVTISGLGGKERAARQITLYLRWPESFWPRGSASTREWTNGLYILGFCGRHGVPGLIRALSNNSVSVRCQAAGVLGSIGRDAEDAVPALERLINDKDGSVRRAAAEALKEIRGEEVPK